jgi:hypothetical protein
MAPRVPGRASGTLSAVRLLVFAVLAALVLPASAQALPRRWPKHVAVGVTSQPGQAKPQRADARFDFRYQYLTGGANTGSGWSTWNPGGSFVTRYVKESRAAHAIPVFTYYQLLDSRPGTGGGEDTRDLSNLRDRSTMRAYFKDLRLALRKARTSSLVVLHVEPDLWGYVQQHAKKDRASSVPAAVASSGDPALKGLPNTASGFARAIVRLRNRLAPNVALAWHLSVWGTKTDPTYSNPSNARLDALARRSATFYRSLHARFGVVFNDVADRDAGFRRHVLGDNGASAWTADDFHRHDRYIRGFTRRTKTKVALWQIPLGNPKLSDTWTHYRDNRVDWWLGAHRAAHLRAARRAGIVAFLFGGGADGTTQPQTDGGHFYRLARSYLRHPLAR